MNRRDKALCQASGCHSLAVRAVEIDLPQAWEATQTYTTLTVGVGLCREHGQEVGRRVEAVLEARSDIPNLLTIIEAAIRFEKAQELRLEAATDKADQLDRECGGLRQQLRDAEAALRLARRGRTVVAPVAQEATA